MDVLDLITLNEAKDALTIDHAVIQYDSILGSYVTSVSRLLDRMCGPIVQRAISNELYDGGEFTIFLDSYPLISVTSVVEYQSTTPTSLVQESNTAKSSSNFSVDLKIGKISRRNSNFNWTFTRGTQNVVVTYIAGRYADTASVDERFKEAARLTLANMWRREQGSGTVTFGPSLERTVGATFALPNAAKQMLFDDFKTPRVG